MVQRLDALLLVLADQIDLGADLPVMAFTHLQPAEPTTLGYRLASYAQDLLEDRKILAGERAALRGKVFEGPAQLLGLAARLAVCRARA